MNVTIRDKTMYFTFDTDEEREFFRKHQPPIEAIYEDLGPRESSLAVFYTCYKDEGCGDVLESVGVQPQDPFLDAKLERELEVAWNAFEDALNKIPDDDVRARLRTSWGR